MPLHSRPLTIFAIVLGAYLTLRGYHSRDGDQAYRLPLLWERLDPTLYPGDPFVDALAAFNPHHGYLTVLEIGVRTIGLSSTLAVLFALTFACAFLGIARLAMAIRPEFADRAGVLAFVMVLAAKAGSIGGNHLFEAMLLDRLMAGSLIWLAFAAWIIRPETSWRVGPWLMAGACWIHPSLGLQSALLIAAFSLVVIAIEPRARQGLALSLVLLILVAIPLYAKLPEQSRILTAGLPVEDYLLWSASVQNPQHLSPRLWRTAQWLAWFGYGVLAALAIAPALRSRSRARPNPVLVRFAILGGLLVLGLFAAWLLIELTGDPRVILFQPFRMATVARGLALIAIAPYALGLWDRGERHRAVLLLVGLLDDWPMIVAVCAEASAFAVENSSRLGSRGSALGAWLIAFGLGTWRAWRVDPHEGHLVILGGMGAFVLVWAASRGPWLRRWRWRWREGRSSLMTMAAMAACWAVPIGALIASAVPEAQRGGIGAALIERCRFAETPTDDLERLAVWCRSQIEADAMFIGPPGPKTFRLWSRRSLAFNRAASPYHAAGLADWGRRFQDHVGFRGSLGDFARAYLADRQGLERRYNLMTDRELAELARRQGASHVIAGPDPNVEKPQAPALELARREGRYAVYRVR